MAEYVFQEYPTSGEDIIVQDGEEERTALQGHYIPHESGVETVRIASIDEIPSADSIINPE